MLCYNKKCKTFSVLIYSYINTSGIGKTRNCVETRRPNGGVFALNIRVFPISTSVDITVYLYGKNVLYFFYNIAQKNTKLLQWMSGGKFSVFTSSYVNMALNQSAIRIHKCYVINCTNTAFKSILKLVKLQSLVANCYRTWKISACKLLTSLQILYTLL